MQAQALAEPNKNKSDHAGSGSFSRWGWKSQWCSLQSAEWQGDLYILVVQHRETHSFREKAILPFSGSNGCPWYEQGWVSWSEQNEHGQVQAVLVACDAQDIAIADHSEFATEQVPPGWYRSGRRTEQVVDPAPPAKSGQEETDHPPEGNYPKNDPESDQQLVHVGKGERSKKIFFSVQGQVAEMARAWMHPPERVLD